MAVAACACALPATAGAATIEVTRAADELDVVADAKCSLREAVESARLNSAIGGCESGGVALDTIKLSARDYGLTIPTTHEDANANGDLDIDGGGPVVLTGEGADATQISTALADRVIDISTPTSLRQLEVGSGDVVALGAADGRGGNIRQFSNSNLTLDRVAVTEGAAIVGGGLYYAGTGTLKIKRSEFDSNHADGLGGGLDAILDVNTQISKSIFQGNTVTDPGGQADGGAISNRGISMTITDSTIFNNTAEGAPMRAAAGGGIHSPSTSDLTVRRSLIAENSAIAPTDGQSERGGGIYAGSGGAGPDEVRIINSTLYANTAGASDGLGGGVYIQGTTTFFENVTFNANTGGDGAGDVFTQTGYAFLRNSILEGTDPCGGSLIDSGSRNVAQVDDPECDLHATDVTDATSLGFKTGFPQANGGITQTIALKKSSPAVNLIPKASCVNAEGQDQRRYKRRGKCDAGSFERKAKP